MDILNENKKLWDALVVNGNQWTKPVSAEEIARARKGDFSLVLTPSKPVPADWYPPLNGADVLLLAGGGGQQGPILSAAGANVTVFDNSPLQLKQDQLVAEREGLKIRTVEGDMQDLSVFANERFDFIFHPCSNCFSEKILPVWREAFRVLRPGGTIITGFTNPFAYLFDPELEKQGTLQLKFTMPYSDLTSITPEEREKYFPGDPVNFAHSLEDQIGGQIAAGFSIIGFYEDRWGGTQAIDKYLPVFIATRALKPKR